jgi:mannose/fructose-specific phosphotransferase system component IIA
MSEVSVYLGGEGNNELGSRCGDPVYQEDSKPGIIEILLRGVQPTGWNVVGARKWCQIRKLRAKGPTPADGQNVLGLVVEAKRAQAQVVAFVRDADDDKHRAKIIADAIRRANAAWPEVEVIGGTAIPVLEAWILAMQGEHRTESLGKAAAQSKLEQKGISAKDTDAMVDVAAKVVFDKLPKDATSFRAWLATATGVLPRLVRNAS